MLNASYIHIMFKSVLDKRDTKLGVKEKLIVCMVESVQFGVTHAPLIMNDWSIQHTHISLLTPTWYWHVWKTMRVGGRVEFIDMKGSVLHKSMAKLYLSLVCEK